MNHETVILSDSSPGRLPEEVWTNDRVQIGVSMLGIERLGFKPNKGIVQYALREEIELDHGTP